MSLYPLLWPLLARLDAERAHGLAIGALARGLVPGGGAPGDPVLKTRLLGLELPSPIGLAAGFDKNAEVPARMLRLGFGFVEVGTLTPRPQAGNARPRLFRLVEDRGAINRLGFNNAGFEAARVRLTGRRRAEGVVGINVGANRDSADPIADYVAGVATFAPLADYLVVNVSSPNTPGLRDLQGRARLDALLGAVLAARDAAAAGRRVPVVLKIAPDLAVEDLADIAEVALARAVDAVAISNTTVARDGLASPLRTEAGGLSGRPLFRRSTEALGRFWTLSGGRLPLIGIGGVEDGATAYAKIRQGAAAVQLYTAMVYEGPGLARRVARELAALLRRDGFAHVAAAVGADHRGGTGPAA